MSCAGFVSVGLNRTTHAHFVQMMQASALLACVEQCPTTAPTNAVQFPRYPSIAVPMRRSPEFASSFSAFILLQTDRSDTILQQRAEPVPSSIGQFSSATVAIVGIQLAGFGLPAIRDATCMQVNALVDLSAVMM
jgi:hypothetical protein